MSGAVVRLPVRRPEDADYAEARAALRSGEGLSWADIEAHCETLAGSPRPDDRLMAKYGRASLALDCAVLGVAGAFTAAPEPDQRAAAAEELAALAAEQAVRRDWLRMLAIGLVVAMAVSTLAKIAGDWVTARHAVPAAEARE